MEFMSSFLRLRSGLEVESGWLELWEVHCASFTSFATISLANSVLQFYNF